jgi:uncharacterized protein YcbK (DUF882 family)
VDKENSRRLFLKWVSGTAFSFPLLGLLGPLCTDWGGAALKKPPVKVPTIPEKKLSFYNVHTGEWIKKTTFWCNGSFVQSSLSAINHLFRDHRTHLVHPIDPKLLLLLHDMSRALDTISPIHLISGYRSKKTNDQLHEQCQGVAKESLHTRGKAADIFIEGRSLAAVGRTLTHLRRGGVGRYDRFVHVDTGRTRYWGRQA